MMIESVTGLSSATVLDTKLEKRNDNQETRAIEESEDSDQLNLDMDKQKIGKDNEEKELARGKKKALVNYNAKGRVKDEGTDYYQKGDIMIVI